jgi:hypothetical protein
MDMPDTSGLSQFPANWDEEAKDLAFHAGLTASYYARALSAQSVFERGMFADILGDRLAEIKRRGWVERADKYLDWSGSTFDLLHMAAWVDRALRECREFYAARQSGQAAGAGNGRTGGNRRFAL